MPRLVDVDKLRERMYHEAFEKDSDLQRWDSGCWIRYKLFEQVLEETPEIDLLGFTLEELMTAAVVVRMAGLTPEEFHELIAKACEEV